MIINRAKETLRIEAEAIIALIDRIDDNFVEAINLIDNCKGRLIVVGIGKSGIIGKKIAATLTSIGISSFFLHAAEAIHGDLGMIGKNDVVFGISNSGETDEVLALIPIIRRFGVPFIALTGNPSSTLARESDVSLDVSIKEEACPLGIVPTASTTATLAMGDAIAMALLDKRNVTEKDFAQFHPGGSLGKRLLLKVEDMMHTGKEIPVVRDNALLSDVVLEITSKKMGMTVVIDKQEKVLGIVTDGDLRRHFTGENIKNLHACEVMTTNPKVIDKTELAASAVQVMESNKITSILVLKENEKVEGVIHLHDLLQRGLF